MKKNSNVTAYIEVFNEEERIEACLKSFSWADELFVFDKQSTDKTFDIAKKYATEVISVPFCDGSENIVKNIQSRGTCDWCIFPTASSLIHPGLVDELLKLTTDKNFQFDVIGMPYMMYSFGVSGKHSPYYNTHKRTLIRRNNLVVSTKLHNEIGFNSSKIYDLNLLSPDMVLYHCTHKDAKSFILQTLRYTEYESINDMEETHVVAFKKLIKSVAKVSLIRRSYMMGWDGIGVATAYVIYFGMRFLMIWDRRRTGGDVMYAEIRKKINQLWDDRLE